MLVLAYVKSSKIRLRFEAFRGASDSGSKLSVLSCEPLLKENGFGYVDCVYREYQGSSCTAPNLLFEHGLVPPRSKQQVESQVEEGLDSDSFLFSFHPLRVGWFSSSNIVALYGVEEIGWGKKSGGKELGGKGKKSGERENLGRFSVHVEPHIN
ncbi:unnamed protein product [Prunus armeniaca]|uniref:Uncharacterized protein n=1 Tax=Prunus armeniaca TaxID=36596 RepID=A0A6J5VXQ6_PRUAR|nr:unnamed protein product [Prunus armeniaca]